MIQIDDNDLPIIVAEKLIKAKRPLSDGTIEKAVNRVLGGEGECEMFTVNELREISEYLRVFCDYNEEK